MSANSRPVAPIDLEAVILAGGLGSRLRPVVNDRPKPMALVGGKPFLEWLIKDLRNQGVQRLILCVGYMGETIEGYFGSGHEQGLEIVYSREAAPLGTGGAIKLALPNLRGLRFFALNGDSLCDFSLRAMLNTHIERSAAATLWLVSVDDGERYGAVKINDNQEITEFREKSATGQAGMINAGVYFLKRRLLDALPANRALSLETDAFPAWLAGEAKLLVLAVQGPFLDIGTPESVRDAERFIQENCANATRSLAA